MKAFTVYYDAETGELTQLTESVAFAGESQLMRADVFQDAIFAITARYAVAKTNAFSKRKKAKR